MTLKELLSYYDACPTACEWAGAMGIGEAWFSCGSARWLQWVVRALDLDLGSHFAKASDCADAALSFVTAHPDTSKYELGVVPSIMSSCGKLTLAIDLFRGKGQELCNKIRDIYTDAVDAVLRSRHGVGLIDIPTIQSSDRTKETT